LVMSIMANYHLTRCGGYWIAMIRKAICQN
jgi:hypothetical protein